MWAGVQHRATDRTWRTVWILAVALCALCALLPLHAQAQNDSIRYEPKLGHYLLYERDSIGQWKLKQVWDREGYLSHCARKWRGEDYSAFGKRRLCSEGKVKSPGELSLVTNGTLSLSLSETRIQDENPALNSMMRRRSFVDVVQRSNINVLAKYGEHLRLDLQYNTETSIEAQRTRLRLQYVGGEFDFIQRLEAGNIRMDSHNPLIDAGRDLFGLLGVFRAGPVELKLIGSRQHDSERKVIVRGGKQVRYFDIQGSHYDFAKHFFLSEYFAQRYDDALSSLPLISSTLHIDRVEVWVSSATQYTQRSDVEPVQAFTTPVTQTSAPPDESMLTGASIAIPRAVKLPESAYTLNPSLGYISLQAPLSDDQLLAVVYTYHIDDKEHTVGSYDSVNGSVQAVLLSDRTKSPDSPLWGLMMKNAYSLPGITAGLSPQDFTAQIIYRNPRTNTDEHTITEGNLKGQTWGRVFGWDATNSSMTGDRPDGVFDFIENATISTRSGTLFLPQRRPFVTIPKRVNSGGASPYPLYSILYSGTRTEAERASAEDRFVIRGTLRSSRTQVTNLGTVQLQPGSVTARQGGQVLQEGVDFEINYMSGDLSLKPHVQGDVEVTIRERELARTKEKNIIGAETNIDLLPGLSIGGTIMNHSEHGRFGRVRFGEEPLNNTLWGFHANYRTISAEWTEKLRELTHLDLTAPSSLELHASYASLTSKYNTQSNKIILEDFERSGMVVDLTSPRPWKLGSNPTRTNDQRAQMSWFMIDPLLVREGARHQPIHLREDPMARAHPTVREIRISELLPQRDQSPYLNDNLATLSISFYPNERGPYNTSTTDLRADGTLNNPMNKWGAMIRPLEVHDFEKEGIAYLEGWLLDPTEYAPSTPNPGILWIDLGQISEDVLPDQRLAVEGSMPTVDTDYGRVPSELPQAYTFDRSGSISMKQQDHGLNGLTSEEERSHSRYSQYLREIEAISTFRPWEEEGYAKPGHPFTDPAGDDYHFFLGEEWDRSRASILERYKYINGTEGNSLDREIQGLQCAQTWDPDVEDTDRDFTLQREEHFFRYAVPISKEGLRVNGNHVVAERILSHAMPDGSTMQSRWIKLRIPLRKPTSRRGMPRWQNIRSIRLSLTNFEHPVHLRWGLLKLVSMPWMPFETALDSEDRRTAELSISTIGVEEESTKEPIPYVSPPGVERHQELSASLVREDEKSLVLSAKNLEPGQAVAVYQSVKYDLRHYRDLSLYCHMESKQIIPIGDLELFIRIGNDFTDNYYEYRIPLQQTNAQNFEGIGHEQLQQLVWPRSNHLSVPLELFTALKEHRNINGFATNKLILMPSQSNGLETIGVRGFPTLADVTGIMMGLRSRSRQNISAEVWVNELAVSGAGKLGGDALLVSGRATLSDLLTIEGDGGYRSAGFGGIQSDVRKVEQNDSRHYNLRGRLQLDQLLPRSWSLQAPITYSITSTKSTPKYNPYSSDMPYTDDSSLSAGTLFRSDRWSLHDWHIDPISKTQPRLFALSNLRFSYDVQQTTEQSPEVASRRHRIANSSLNYSYDPSTGSYLRLSSEWNRQFLFTRFAEDQTSGGGSFAGQWDWRRALSLRWMPWRWLTLGLESSTTALIREPFEDEYLSTGQPHFRLLTQEIMHSILSLGETMSANSRTEISLNLPRYESKPLSPLTASLTWRSNYNWTRGHTTAQSFGGHRASNSGYLDLHAGYLLRDLFTQPDRAPLQHISIHLRHTHGSTLPAFLPQAGKAMGIGVYERSMAPTLWYMLAIGSSERHIQKALRQKWLLTEETSLFRRPTYYARNEAEGQITLSPLPGLQIELTAQYLHHHQTTVTPSMGTEFSRQRSGTVRLSTVGLRHFMEHPLKTKGFSSQLFDRLTRMQSRTSSLPEAFVRTYTLTGRLHEGLPSLSMLLPNWNIHYDLTKSFPSLSRYVQNLTLKNSYRGYIEYPNYRFTTARDATTAPSLTPHTIVHLDEMSPLAGIATTFKFGLELEERFTRRRTTTLLTTSSRLMAQYDTELYSSLRYRYSFPALFRIQIPLLRSSEHEIRFQLNHIYTRSYLLTRNLNSLYTSPTQGLDAHTLNTSIEYALSRAVSLRAFLEQERRIPLVSNMTYPYRRTTYGILLLLNLTP